jgi:hypothetical protein
MGHTSRPLEPDSLRNTLEILAVTTEAVVNGMAKLMNQGI